MNYLKFFFPTALLLLLLAGCGGKTTEASAPSAVCFAVANTANSQALNLSSPVVQEAAKEAIGSFGFVSVVSIDGSPEVLMAQSFDIPEKYKKASKEKLAADAKNNAAALLSGLQGIAADDPEADYLEGLRMAVRSLSAADGCGEKKLVVLGTGLSTAGTLDFRNNLLLAEPEQIVDMLAQRSEIPDFSGITVVWQQLGDVAQPQSALSQSQRQRLDAIWRAIVERGGGSFVLSEGLYAPADPEAIFPPVSVVELPAEEPIVFEPEVQLEPEILRSPILLTEEQVTFVGDQANYLHPDEAVQTITPIAEMLLRNPQIRILLVGATAGDATNSYTTKLSKDRADTVRDTLIGLGVPADHILTVGMGASDPWHISGAGIEGSIAAANRKVVLLDADSDMAREILGSGK